LGIGLSDRAQQFRNMVWRITQIHVQGHDVVAPTKFESSPKCLAEPQILAVVQNVNVIPGSGEGLCQCTGLIGAPVVDDHHLPAVLVLE
jgi:hypothetical protein